MLRLKERVVRVELCKEGTVTFPGSNPGIPEVVWARLRSFLLDKRSGVVTLNIKDGHILSARIEDVVTVTRAEVRAQP